MRRVWPVNTVSRLIYNFVSDPFPEESPSGSNNPESNHGKYQDSEKHTIQPGVKSAN